MSRPTNVPMICCRWVIRCTTHLSFSQLTRLKAVFGILDLVGRDGNLWWLPMTTRTWRPCCQYAIKSLPIKSSILQVTFSLKICFGILLAIFVHHISSRRGGNEPFHLNLTCMPLGSLHIGRCLNGTHPNWMNNILFWRLKNHELSSKHIIGWVKWRRRLPISRPHTICIYPVILSKLTNMEKWIVGNGRSLGFGPKSFLQMGSLHMEVTCKN